MSCSLPQSALRRLITAVLAVQSGLFWLPSQGADIEKLREGTATNSPGFRPLVADDRPTQPKLAPASNEGEIRIKQFKHVPGLHIDLWAAEPMLANPVAFSVDEQGRIYTSETYRYRTSVLDIRHYMFMLEDDLAARTIDDRLAMIRKWFGPQGEQALSRETEVIRLLEDTNRDGRADSSRIFADGFTSPLDGIASGVLARNGEVWFTDIPSVWKVSPKSGTQEAVPPPRTPLASQPKVMDGHQAEELLRGFGVRFSYTGHDLHGLKFGPDGRLYFSVGDRGAHVVTREGTVIDLPDEGAVFRCEPDGSRLEVVHRGLRNPQELAFNEYGDLFSGDNDSDQGDRERWVQIIEGADSGWRVGHQHAPLGNAGMWNLERLWVPHFEGQAAYLLPPIANIGDGPSGLVYDYGTSFPAAWKNRFLLAYFKGTSAKSGVVSIAIRPSRGGGYELVAHDEFVWNSLVPDVDLGPDGAVYFADWHEGWPKSNKGRIYRATFPEVLADPVVQQTATLLREGFTKRSEAELLTILGHRDQRVRQEAQFALAGRGKSSWPALQSVALGTNPQLARIHAVWGLGQIVRATDTPGQSPTTAWVPELTALLPLLKDPDAEIRVQAARMLGEAELLEAADGLAALAATDPSARVQVAAALALRHSAYGRRHAADALDRLQARNADADSPRSAQHNPSPTAVQILTRCTPEDRELRHAATLLLQRALRPPTQTDPNAVDPFLVERLRAHPNTLVRLATVVALRQLASAEVAWLLTDSDPLVVLEAARAINDAPIPGAYAALAQLAEPARLDLLRQRLSTPTPAAEPAAIPALQPVALRDVRADQPLPWTNAPVDQLSPLLLRIVNANFRAGTPETADRLAQLALNAQLPEAIRTEALFALFHWINPPARDRIVGTYRPLPSRRDDSANLALRRILPQLLNPQQTPGAVTLATCRFLGDRPLLESQDELQALVRNRTVAPDVRAAALRAWLPMAKMASYLSSQSDATPKFTAEAKTLLAYASAESAEVLRLEASKLSAELDPSDAAGRLAAQLKSASLAEQQSAYASLGDLKSPAADALLADALEQLMKREIANEVMLDLVEAAAKRPADAVKSRLAAYQDWKLPKDHLSPYREALFGGNAERGRKIFYENAAVSCTRCHQIGSDGGGNAGPKLDGLATRTTREHVLESIVFPNQQVVPGFESAIITLKDGQTYAGVVKSENDTSLILLAPEEGEVTLKKSDLSSREKGLSGMPEGMGQLLTRQELRDVIEFLGTLK
ncbi:MAG: PQQ-dependent sugar dehydrogenase [Verrucomicrobia bacterium]|nr:PQQ-dependent sugar dehydrogenase [Verrucomicrobiota bacterium]